MNSAPLFVLTKRCNYIAVFECDASRFASLFHLDAEAGVQTA